MHQLGIGPQHAVEVRAQRRIRDVAKPAARAAWVRGDDGLQRLPSRAFELLDGRHHGRTIQFVKPLHVLHNLVEERLLLDKRQDEREITPVGAK